LNPYEMTFIVRPDKDEDETRAAVQTVTGRSETIGGEVIATAPWNPPRRRMAYPIREFGDGYYVTTVFRMNAEGVRLLENSLKLNENVLRYLMVRATDNAVEQVQQRAQQAYLAASQPPQAPTPDATTPTATSPVATTPDVVAPAATAVSQPEPAEADQAEPGTTVDAEQPEAVGAPSTTQE
jgi:small subunit ribosomal protein S6